MGALSMAKVPWEKWAKWVIPLHDNFIVLGLLLLIPPNLFGWQ